MKLKRLLLGINLSMLCLAASVFSLPAQAVTVDPLQDGGCTLLDRGRAQQPATTEHRIKGWFVDWGCMGLNVGGDSWPLP